jgi:hypothetical protein
MCGLASPDKTPLELCAELHPYGWARILDTAQLTIAERQAIREIKVYLEAALDQSDRYFVALNEERKRANTAEAEVVRLRQGTPEERIAAVLHSIGFGQERFGLAARMLKFAQEFEGDPIG